MIGWAQTERPTAIGSVMMAMMRRDDSMTFLASLNLCTARKPVIAGMTLTVSGAMTA